PAPAARRLNVAGEGGVPRAPGPREGGGRNGREYRQGQHVSHGYQVPRRPRDDPRSDLRQEASRLDARRGDGARAPGLADRSRGYRRDLTGRAGRVARSDGGRSVPATAARAEAATRRKEFALCFAFYLVTGRYNLDTRRNSCRRS